MSTTKYPELKAQPSANHPRTVELTDEEIEGLQGIASSGGADQYTYAADWELARLGAVVFIVHLDEEDVFFEEWPTEKLAIERVAQLKALLETLYEKE